MRLYNPLPNFSVSLPLQRDSCISNAGLAVLHPLDIKKSTDAFLYLLFETFDVGE
jgi:hypothetical protein